MWHLRSPSGETAVGAVPPSAAERILWSSFLVPGVMVEALYDLRYDRATLTSFAALRSLTPS